MAVTRRLIEGLVSSDNCPEKIERLQRPKYFPRFNIFEPGDPRPTRSDGIGAARAIEIFSCRQGGGGVGKEGETMRIGWTIAAKMARRDSAVGA